MNILSWSWCERFQTFTSVEKVFKLNIVSWSWCRKRIEIFTLVEMCFEKNQSLWEVDIVSWSWCRETRVVNILKHSRRLSCFAKKINVMSWTSCRERLEIYKKNHFVYVIVMPWTSCRGRLETYTLVELCFFFKSITSLREHRVLIVNVMTWTSCGERLEIWKKSITSFTWTSCRESRVVNVLKYSRWSNCFLEISQRRDITNLTWTP